MNYYFNQCLGGINATERSNSPCNIPQFITFNLSIWQIDMDSTQSVLWLEKIICPLIKLMSDTGRQSCKYLVPSIYSTVSASVWFTLCLCVPVVRRAMKRPAQLSCPFQNACVITKSNRRQCQSCRLQKCLSIGMKRERKFNWVLLFMFPNW